MTRESRLTRLKWHRDAQERSFGGVSIPARCGWLCCFSAWLRISFFVLSYMIRRRITEPVDQLAAAAEQINEGNLDVDIAVHEGGEFEGLERAFKQMVDSWRTYIDKSVGEE